MTNRIDSFQPEQSQLSIPAAKFCVYLDNSPCEQLEVAQIVREDWPNFSYAKLNFKSSKLHDENQLISPGKQISIRQVFNKNSPDVSIDSICIFAGQIEEIEKDFGPDGQKFEITARDVSSSLRRKLIYGKRAANADGSSIFLAGAGTCFNEFAKPNAIDFENKVLFAEDTPQNKFWTYAEIIRYLLTENLIAGQLQITSLEQLEELTGFKTARDLDLTGLDLLEALHRCCDEVCLKFKFEPAELSGTCSQAIIFYKQNTGRCVELNCQGPGERFCVSKTSVTDFKSTRNFSPVTHKYIAMGGYKTFEATFDLIKAWDGSLETSNYEDFSASTNPDFFEVKDVFRKWCLNETGDYQGEVFDFSKIFETENYLRKPRQFYPMISTDSNGQSLGYFVQVSFDNGQNWWQFNGDFHVLDDRCGIYLSADKLDVETWAAAVNGTLKFKITASVQSDDRLSVVLADGPVNSASPVIEHLITLPRRFQYNKIHFSSCFSDRENEVDDWIALFEFVNDFALVNASVIETINLKTAYIAADYQIGDIITTSPQSVDLFSYRADNRSISTIESVTMDFQKQSTELQIVRKRRPQIC